VDARTQRFEVSLRDGSSVLIRPIEPGDKWRLSEGLRQLSPRSRFSRFHAPVDRLTDAQLAYLTEIDYDDHMAWLALDPEEPDEPGMGVARYVRLRGEPEVAEAAVTVLDRHQGKGLGTLLFELLVRSAIAHGVRVLRNYVLASNEGMLAIFDELGATRRYEGGGAYVVDVPLPDDPDELPGTGAAEVLRASARHELPPMRMVLPPANGPTDEHGWATDRQERAMAEETVIEELSKEECYELLAAHPAHVGRIAIAGARPLILPVNYALDGEDVVFRTIPGSRFADAVSGEFVAFEVDFVHAAWHEGWSVLIRGKADVVTDEADRTRLTGLDLRPWAPGDRDLYVRVRADIVTGRRITGR
jgi:nitroimidazol reductase NimA-like FMN-containing flavoprotein (pyridoxamine 5'-phosphate oxidase superfamily)/GNAT superfamily N-acetyltransferase